MIKADFKTGETHLKGSQITLLTEFTMIARGLRKAISESWKDDMGDDVIQYAFELSKKSQAEIDRENEELFRKIFFGGDLDVL